MKNICQDDKGQAMFTSKKTIGLVVVTLLLVIVPISVYLAQREQRVETRAQDATGSIFGTVKDEKSQSGATGIKMILQKLNTTTGEYTHVGTIFTTQTGEYQFTGREYGEYSVFPDPNATEYTVKQPLVRRITLSSSQADHYFIDFTIELKTPQQPLQPPQQPAQPPGGQQPSQGINVKELEGCPGFELTLFATSNDTKPIKVPNPLCLSGINGIRSIIILAVQILLTAVAVISFFMLLWGGLGYILSGGDPKGIENARKRITFAIIGLAVSFFALVTFVILGNIFGFSNLLKPSQDPLGDAVRREIDQFVNYCSDPAQNKRQTYDDCIKRLCRKYPESSENYKNCVRLGGAQ